jgi:hypothetical protein
MQIEIDYDNEVHNGDIGYLDDVEPGTGELTARLRRQNGHLRVWRTRHAGCLPMLAFTRARARNIQPDIVAPAARERSIALTQR